MDEVSISCTESQLNAIESSLQPDTLLNLIAGPGTGKTKTLVDRIAYALSCGIDPSQIVVFSLTRKTVEDFKIKMLDILGENLALGVQVCTFHSFCFQLVKHKYPNVAHFHKSSRMDTDFIHSFYKLGNSIRIRRMFNQEYYNLLLKYDFPTIMGSKSITKKDRDTIFFDKCVLEAAQIARETPDIVLNECKLIMIDEFQDVSSIIMEFLKEVVKGKHLTIAGDIDQSIYGFTGAFPSKNWGTMDKIYNKSNRKDLVLENSFRLPENLIKVATNSLHSKTTLLKSAVRGEAELIPFRVAFERPEAEAEFIRNEIDKLVSNSNGTVKPGDIAVLSHSNASADAIGVHLSMFGKFPVSKLKDEQSWKKSPLSMILDFLKIINDPHDDNAMVSVCRHLGSVGPATLRKLKEIADSVGESIYTTVLDHPELLDNNQHKLVSPFVNYLGKIELDVNDSNSIMYNLVGLCSQTNFKKMLESMPPVKIQKELMDLNEDLRLIAKVMPIKEDESTLLQRFLENYDQTNFYKRLMKMDSSNAITISTIHTAKGREWNVVFITSTINDNRRISSLSTDLNCNFVGVTRAKHLLYYNRDQWTSLCYTDYASSIGAPAYQGTLKYLPHLISQGTPNNLNQLPRWSSSKKGIDIPTINRLVANMDIRKNIGISLLKRVYKCGRLV